jgi:membrane protease YdiL (CAAX protease family)
MGLGGAAALACVLIGLWLFGTGADNWFVSIAANFARSVNLSLPVWQLALTFTIVSMSFSPIGEEIFFRGLMQHALAQRFSARVGTRVECIAFGLVHLCHHGVVMSASGLEIQPYSAPIWFGLMVVVACLFARIREHSASLYPAIAAHAAYNLVMSIGIFTLLWPSIDLR